MDKKVFCSLQGRSKCVKFQRDPSVSDVAIIRGKIRNICKRDTCFKKFIENKVIVVQKKDNDEDVWIDVEDDDIIEDKEKLDILLLPTTESAPDVLEGNDGNFPDKILYTEPLNDLGSEKFIKNQNDDASTEGISEVSKLN